MPKQVIDKDKLIDQAYSIAAREGISALSVRKLAAACGIAVGSVYMYFPTKADLTAAVFTRFFGQALFEAVGLRGANVSLTTCGNCAALWAWPWRTWTSIGSLRCAAFPAVSTRPWRLRAVRCWLTWNRGSSMCWMRIQQSCAQG